MSTILTFDNDPKAVYQMGQFYDIVSDIKDNLIRQIFASLLGQWQGDLESDEWDDYSHHKLVDKLSNNGWFTLLGVYSEITKLAPWVIKLLTAFDDVGYDNDQCEFEYIDSEVGIEFEDFIYSNFNQSIFSDSFSTSSTWKITENVTVTTVEVEGELSILFQLIEILGDGI